MGRGDFIQCDSHGRKRWTGQVICVHCQRVWHLNVSNPPTQDGTCVCGQPLDGKDGTARAICPDCYDSRKDGPT